jgi:YVTN family beta-propeller protein
MVPLDKEESNPYVGPRAFEPEDKELFFGRSQETEELVSLIFAHPVVLVYAESGAGKTSLLNAQVIPTLEKSGFQVLPVARVKGEPPDNVDLEDITNLYIFNVLHSLSPHFNHPILMSKESLSTFLKLSFVYPRKVDRRQRPSSRVLIIDQFEELFGLYPKGWREQQNSFFQQISDAVTADPMLRVVLVIREDYLAQLDPFSHFLPERLRPRLRLVRLDREAALLAINGPLKNTKRSYAKGVAEELVEELLKIQVETDPGRAEKETGEYVEPVQLQVVCERLWQKLPPEVTEITKNYVGNVDNALADFYVKAIRDASAESGIDEACLRDWCETKLITSSGTRSIIHRGAEMTGGLPNRVVDVLENRRFIRVEQRSGARWYELTHDRLIGPIKDSNKVWKYEREREKYEREREKYEREKKKKSLIIKTTIPVIAAILIGMLVANYYDFFSVRNPDEVTTFSIGQAPFIPTVNPTTDLVYIPDTGSNKVFVIKGITNKVIGNLTVGKKPVGVSVNPKTNMVYVANSGSNTVSIIDGNTNIKDILAILQQSLGALIYGSNNYKNNIITNTTVTNVPVGKNPSSISINPNTNLVYVANTGSNTTSVINGTINRVVADITVGDFPASVSVDPHTNLVYVANSGSNTVSIIDGKINKVIHNLTVGQNPYAVSVNPDTNLIYVANQGNNTVSILDGKTNNLVRTLPIGNGPVGLSINPITNLIYIANQGSNTVSILDGKTNNLVRTLGVGNGLEGLFVNPKTNMVYASDKYDNTVTAMNALKMGIIKIREVDNYPNGIAVNPLTNRLYVSNSDSKTLSIVDGKTNKVISNVNVHNGSYYASVNPNTDLVYVADYDDKRVSIIDGKTNKLLPMRLVVGAGSYYASVNPNTNLVYVANYDANRVSIIDGKTNKVIGNLTVGQNPSAVSVNPNTNLVYVANCADNTVSIIDGKTNKVIHNLTVGGRPIGISVNSETNRIYVSNSDSKTVSVINGKTNAVERTLAVGNGPSGISVNPKTNMVYVANSGDDSISIINGRYNNVVQTLPVGENTPSGVSVNPNTNLVYVVNSLSNSISIINGTTIKHVPLT